ncbi:MAG TPA: universal stress protein [Spirochaetales bacterium]|nr:universal stress protein [Spirochaetales bacterium]
MIQAIRRILVYVDGSGESYSAARMAIVLAKTMGAELFSLSVVNTRALGELVQAHIFLEAEREEYRRDLEGDVERYVNRVRELGRKKGIAVNTEHVSGSVFEEISKAVSRHGADLLVMGSVTEVRSRREDLFADTERAARMVPCSVLIAKDEDRIDELYEAL